MLMYGQLAMRNLWAARRRSTLLGAALGSVSFFMVMMMTLSQGMGDTMVRVATLLLTGHVNVGGFYKTRPTNAATVVTPVAPLMQLLRSEMPQVRSVVERGRGWGRVISAQASLEAMLSGVDLQQETELTSFMQLAPEREYVADGTDAVYGDLERLADPHSTVLFAAQAQRLGVRVGDMVTLSAEALGGRQNTDEVRVVAIVRDAGFLSHRHVLVSAQTARELYRLNDRATGIIMLTLRDIGHAAGAMALLRQVLTAHGYPVRPHDPRPWRVKQEAVRGEAWTGERLDLTTWKDELGSTLWILETLDGLTVLCVTIMALIVVAGIINTMWIAVGERTQEIGMMRAIGMSRPRVLGLLLSEGAILGAMATSMGSLLGAGAATAIDALRVHVPFDAVQAVLMSDVVTLAVRPLHLVQTVLLFTSCTALATLWPALRAARLQPLSAIEQAG